MMKGRFLKISSYYRGFLNYYYQLNPDISAKSYQEQFKHLMGQCFAWSDNYGILLAEKGLETMEVVANAQHLQQAWSKEFGNQSTNLNDILLEQIGRFKPEVIFFQDSVTYNGNFISQIKERYPFIKLCIGNLCAPFSSMQLESFQVFDFFIVCSPLFQKQLKKYGIESYNIPHAFDGRILNEIEKDNHYHHSSFAFMGSIFADEGFHSLRRELLENLIASGINISFYGNLPDKSTIGLLKRQASYIAAKTLNSVGLRSLAEAYKPIRKGLVHQAMPNALKLSKQLYKIAQPPVFGLNMFKVLSKADIGFNIHIDCAGDYAANMRMFETAGVGTCLVTDWKKNLSDFYEDGVEAVSYKSKEECIEKIKWLVDHPDECKEIAKKGQKRTLKEHNFESRVQLFYKALEERL